MKHSVKEWFLVTRPWGYPASLIPGMVAMSYVFYAYKTQSLMDINWWYGALATLGAAIWQASGNMISDYYDFKYKVDRLETYGTGRMLVEGNFTPKEVYRYSLSLMFLGTLIGLYLLFNTSIHLLWIGVLGALGTYFYFYMKYRAWGDFNIFILYGQLIALGVYLVMTGKLSWEILLVAAAPGLIIVAILHANNARDIKHDGVVNIKTFAMQLGIKKSIAYYTALCVGSYLLIIVAVVLGVLHPLSLIVLLSLPLMLKNIRQMRNAKVETPEIIKTLDEQTAQHLTAFGVLLMIANVVAGLIV